MLSSQVTKATGGRCGAVNFAARSARGGAGCLTPGFPKWHVPSRQTRWDGPASQRWDDPPPTQHRPSSLGRPRPARPRVGRGSDCTLHNPPQDPTGRGRPSDSPGPTGDHRQALNEVRPAVRPDTERGGFGRPNVPVAHPNTGHHRTGRATKRASPHHEDTPAFGRPNAAPLTERGGWEVPHAA